MQRDSAEYEVGMADASRAIMKEMQVGCSSGP
jgi:hypothetical protein